MTNLWLDIPTEKLCNQHLLGLHNEIHQEAGTIKNHPFGQKILQGHYRLGQLHTTELQKRHEEVVQEMQKRGMNQDSRLKYRDQYGLIQAGFPIQKYNEISLASRCNDCKVIEE